MSISLSISNLVLIVFIPVQEQKAELLRICSAEDVECLQYHLRAAFGHNPSAGPLPSYAHLGCDPKDPTCKPQLVQKAPSGLFLRYPNCDPRDPRCAYAASLQVRLVFVIIAIIIFIAIIMKL